MTTRTFHAALLNRNFPFNFRELSSTVVVNQGFETNRGAATGFSGDGEADSFGTPQVYFMQNVLPTYRGFSSVNYLELVGAIPGEVSSVEEVFTLRGTGQDVALFAFSTSNFQYIYNPNVGIWQQINLGVVEPTKPYVAYVKERTFLFFPDLAKVFEYNFPDQQFVEVELTGPNMSSIEGICPAGGQLVLWTKDQILWSSQLDPTDFTDVDMGAGATSVLAIKGEIVSCYPMGQDFIIYTASNAVSARQTESVQFPFVFTEVQGSAGLSNRDHVAYDSNTGVHIVYTASGFQQLDLQQAQYVWPELWEAVSKGTYSRLDSLYGRPELVRASGLDIKVQFVSNRWLTCSVRTVAETALGQGFSHAYVFDVTLNRWGRIDIQHRSLFQFTAPEFLSVYTYDLLAENYPTYADLAGVVYANFESQRKTSAPQAGKNFGIVQSSGRLLRAALSETGEFAESTEVTAATPKLFLGRVKFFRTSGARLQHLKLNEMFEGQVRLHAHEYNGEYVATGTALMQNPRHRDHYLGRMTADSVSIELRGKFHLTDLSATAGRAGSRNQRFRTEESDTVLVFAGDDQVLVNTAAVITPEIEP